MSGYDPATVDTLARHALQLQPTQRVEFIKAATAGKPELQVALLGKLEELESVQLKSETGAPEMHTEANPESDPPLGSDMDRLYGQLGVQLGYVSLDALMRTMHEVANGSKDDLGAALVRNRVVTDDEDKLLRQIVSAQLARSGDAHSSLQSLKTASEGATKIFGDPTGSEAAARTDGGTTGGSTMLYAESLGANSRFRVLRPHRKGGLGEVSVARDEELNREVALKEVREEYAPSTEARQRLQIEAEITGRLEHPGIVPVYGLGAFSDGRPYYCMRFIRGDSLDDAIKEFHQSKARMSASERNLSTRNLIRRMIDVCEAIAYAHSRQVLHRDLKPGNIMLGRYGETLVVDWGLAKAIGSAEASDGGTQSPVVPRSGSTAAPTQPGATAGTPEFMSPEQAGGRVGELDDATDVYSLGATLFNLLTGRPPIKRTDKGKVIEDVIRGKFPKPREVDSSISLQLEAICLKAMSLDKEARYDSAIALAKDLERWLADEPIVAKPDTMVQRAGRVLRKRKSAVMGLAATVLTALLGLSAAYAVSVYKNGVISTQRDTLEDNQIVLTAQKDTLEQQKETLEEQKETLQRKNADLQQSQEDLQANYDGLQVLTQRFVKRGEEEFSQDAAMTPVRNWLYTEVVQFVEDFDELHPDNRLFRRDNDSIYWLGKLYLTHGDNLRKQMKIDLGIENVRKAIDMFREASELQAVSNASVKLPQAIKSLSNTLTGLGRYEEADALMDEAILTTERMMADPNWSSNLAAVAHIKAMCVLDSAAHKCGQRHFSDALPQALESVELLEDNRSGDALESVFILALLRAATCHRELGDLEEASGLLDRVPVELEAYSGDKSDRRFRNISALYHLGHFRLLKAQAADMDLRSSELDETIRLLEPLAANFPDFYQYTKSLAAARTLKCAELREQEAYDEAAGVIEIATMEIEQLVEQSPQLVSALETAGDAYLERAEVEAMQGDVQAAAASRAKARTFFTQSPLLAAQSWIQEKLPDAQ